jgi:selenide, water dikinase
MTQVLRQLPQLTNKNVLIGADCMDDAGVYRISDNLALILTVDVFSPIVDDAYTFGQIVAANCLSDIYAMGARPVLVSSIIGFPENVFENSVVADMLKGGLDKINEAGAVSAGHQIMFDREIKYGMAVCGVANPKKIIANSGAKPGDKLILTKPLGTGIISAAVKNGRIKAAFLKVVNKSMTRLNKTASEIMLQCGVNACTDITGFGFLGHAYEMAEQSNVTFVIQNKNIPSFEKTKETIDEKYLNIGSSENKKYLSGLIDFQEKITENEKNILSMPETSGGLFISINKNRAAAFLEKLRNKGIEDAGIVGEVLPYNKKHIRLI